MGVVGKKATEVLYTEEAEAFAKDLLRLSKDSAARAEPSVGDQVETGLVNRDYIARRRAATRAFQDKVRALPEYDVAQSEVERENALANLMIEARERAGFTQAQVAEKMGIGQSAFSRMERGNTTLKNFLKCLNICGYALKLVPYERAAACL